MRHFKPGLECSKVLSRLSHSRPTHSIQACHPALQSHFFACGFHHLFYLHLLGSARKTPLDFVCERSNGPRLATMPSVQELKSKNARAVQEKHLDLISKYTSHIPAVEQLQKLAKARILDNVAQQLQLNEEGKARVLLYLSDFANLFRFYRRSRYDEEQAMALLSATVLWRMRTDLDLLSLSSLNPLYVTPPPPNPPLFWVNSHFKDFYGRPCGVISLRSVERTAENTLDQLKEYIVACMEIMRRYVADLYRASIDNNTNKSSDESTVLQAAIAIDLASSGMANLELELLPFLLDLLKNHVPGMVGAVYVLNYGWVHAGMWAVIKRVLPQQALAKIFFPSHAELREHFDAKAIPVCYGGELDVAIESSSNDVLRKYGRPSRVSSAHANVEAKTPPQSPGAPLHMSRSNSYDSIYEVFYSADSTPWASRPITPRHSEPSTPRGGDAASAGTLKMTPSAARKLKHLQMSRGDLSSAADPRIVDGRAVGLSVNLGGSAGLGSSPFVTPSITPVEPLSPRAPRTRGSDRHVRFSSNNSNFARSESPQRRVGATSNFTLYLPEDQEEAMLLSESEDSDASGKDGELPPAAASSSGFLNRLRRLSETRFTSAPKDKGSEAADNEVAGEGTIMYIDPTPSSPHLQVPHLDEPPLQQHIPHTFLSHRTRRSNRDGLVSPYNANNPFFGYPAFNPTSSEATFKLNRSTTPQHLHSRRRKRDLLRTLTYLFVLRVLAFYRRLRWRVALVSRELARTISGGADNGNGGEDEFWRNLDASRLSALPESDRKKRQKQGGSAMGSMAKKLMGAVVLVMLLRPEWRRRTVLQVYAACGAVVGNRKGEREEVVDWEEWEKRGALLPVSNEKRSLTGLHVRERLGLKSGAPEAKISTTATAAAGENGKRGARNSRLNPLAVAGGLISAASLGYLLYTYLSTSSRRPSRNGGDDDDDDDDVLRRRSSHKPGASSRARPSLSLSLSPTFERSPASIAGLRTLLLAISPLFVVHLILPGLEEDDLSASVSRLSSALGAIRDFDSRRILEYTQASGRFALSRALACDCHVEIALPGSDEQITVVELAKIRRSCSLVVFASFAPAGSGGRAVLDELKRMATGAKDAPDGMRAFNLAHVQTDAKWDHLASKLVELREGWK